MLSRVVVFASLLCAAYGEATEQKKETQEKTKDDAVTEQASDDQDDIDMKMLIDKLQDDDFVQMVVDKTIDKLTTKLLDTGLFADHDQVQPQLSKDDLEYAKAFVDEYTKRMAAQHDDNAQEDDEAEEQQQDDDEQQQDDDEQQQDDDEQHSTELDEQPAEEPPTLFALVATFLVSSLCGAAFSCTVFFLKIKYFGGKSQAAPMGYAPLMEA